MKAFNRCFTNLEYLVYIKIYYSILRGKHDSLKALAGKHDDIIEVQQPWPWKHNKHLYVTRLIYRETCTQHSSIDWYYSATSVCECIALLCADCSSVISMAGSSKHVSEPCKQAVNSLVIYGHQLWVDIVIHWVFPWQCLPGGKSPAALRSINEDIPTVIQHLWVSITLSLHQNCCLMK